MIFIVVEVIVVVVDVVVVVIDIVAVIALIKKSDYLRLISPWSRRATSVAFYLTFSLCLSLSVFLSLSVCQPVFPSYKFFLIPYLYWSGNT